MWRVIIPFAISCFFLNTWVFAQAVFPDALPSLSSSAVVNANLNKTVLPITELKLSGHGPTGKFGTGFCLDPMCRFIATNYHLAMMAKPRKIKGEKIIRRYLATGPDDEGASVNDGQDVSPMKFTLSRDLAIFELRHSLRHFHGVAFSQDELQMGQRVDIYAYPKEGMNPFRNLLKSHATFIGETMTGLLAFEYSLSAGRSIGPGASGGIVVDSNSQQIVGVLNGIARNGETVALAVPVSALADFVKKIEPAMAENLFPSIRNAISPTSRDLYPKPALPISSHILEHRPGESEQVKTLRSKAQVLADSMRNFIAVQTFEWGTKDNPPAAMSAYEVQVLDGNQQFREYPSGKKQFNNVPFPATLDTVMVPGGEWSELPEMVGNELHLRISQARDITIDNKRMKVFQYQANVEDGVCRWQSNFDFGLFTIKKDVIVSCYGEVWTDEDMNILRMSEHYELSGKWKEYMAVVTYGWLERTDETPRLIPLTISTQAQYGKTIHWCRGRFVNYRVFSSRVKITSN
jgi:hypothetical protein